MNKIVKLLSPCLLLFTFTATGFASEPTTVLLKQDSSLFKQYTKKSVLEILNKVADWQLENPTGKDLNTWEYGPFYQGLMKLYKVGSQKKYYQKTIEMGNKVNWEPRPRPYDANSLAIVSAFADVYSYSKDPKMIDKSRFLMDMPVERRLYTAEDGKTFEPEVNLKQNKYWYEWWTWCDALFMAPPAYAQLSKQLNKPEYMSHMVKNWWLTSDYLYSKSDSLFYRDDRAFEFRTVNGKKVFWSRGNGWVIGGLCGVMDYMDKSDPRRKKFEQQFIEMNTKLLNIQLKDGTWSQSLIDPTTYPQKETSGTAFFCYGMAWGINNGLLPKEKYLPAVQKAWTALLKSVDTKGMLGDVQLVGDKPENVSPKDTETYGVGAFLMAGTEIYKMLN